MGGSNGEGPYLKAEEKLEMVSKIRSMIQDDRLLIAGTTCECKMSELYLNLSSIDNNVMFKFIAYSQKNMKIVDIVHIMKKVNKNYAHLSKKIKINQ